MAAGEKWTRDEVVIALALYLSRPFGSLRSTNPDVQAVAGILGRSPGAVSRKVGNIGSFDSDLPAKGLSHAAKADRLVWEEFIGAKPGMKPVDAVFLEAGRIAASKYDADLSFLAEKPCPERTEGTALRKVRLTEGFFRAAVLSNYDGRCAVTGLRAPELLEAAHILPWAEHESLRMVPANGISLCTLLHRAYDVDLIGIDPGGLLHVSRLLAEKSRGSSLEGFFRSLDGAARLQEASRFRPNPDFLAEKYAGFLASQKNGGNEEKAGAFLGVNQT